MNFKEIQELIKLINKSNLTEFKLKKQDFEVSIRTKKYHKHIEKQSNVTPIVHVPSAVPAPMSAPAPAGKSEPLPSSSTSQGNDASSKDSSEVSSDNLIAIKSPIVGTFYRSASPDKPVYVKVGDRIEVGTVVCIVEAMKLFNEIESEVSGTIVKVEVEDASPVEYDQVLFYVDPSK